MKSPSLSSPFVGVEMIGAPGTSTVVMASVQTSMMPPGDEPSSSTTNSRHVPLASVPWKASRLVDQVVCEGAGNGKGSVEGIPAEAVDEKVRLAGELGAAAPTSLMSRTVWPLGAASRTSTSSGDG